MLNEPQVRFSTAGNKRSGNTRNRERDDACTSGLNHFHKNKENFKIGLKGAKSYGPFNDRNMNLQAKLRALLFHELTSGF